MATKTTPKTTKAMLDRVSNSLKNTIARKNRKEKPSRKLNPKEIHKQEIARDTAILIASKVF